MSTQAQDAGPLLLGCFGGAVWAAIVDAHTVQLNVPFSVVPAAGATVGAAVTYVPGTVLPSATIKGLSTEPGRVVPMFVEPP